MTLTFKQATLTMALELHCGWVRPLGRCLTTTQSFHQRFYLLYLPSPAPLKVSATAQSLARAARHSQGRASITIMSTTVMTKLLT